MVQFEEHIQGPVAVIGDIHGQVEKLLAVLDRLRQQPDYEQRWIVLIGDLVDRGPDPKGALDVVCDLMLEHSRTTVICGNHELAMAGALQLLPTPDYADWPTRWLADYGAESTFSSFGVEHGACLIDTSSCSVICPGASSIRNTCSSTPDSTRTRPSRCSCEFCDRRTSR